QPAGSELIIVPWTGTTLSAQTFGHYQKGRPPNIKTARNIQNNTPIRSQPMLQHDSGHMRTATTPLRNIRHAHARKHKYTH
ncbi:hypothetical protein, partial [Bifidobacterium adolescentis]|uniref:hypothetical protein n=1 Tax=Bifidobacterium adolescentis TaxID=1680 RepID=UPI00321B3367